MHQGPFKTEAVNSISGGLWSINAKLLKKKKKIIINKQLIMDEFPANHLFSIPAYLVLGPRGLWSRSQGWKEGVQPGSVASLP